MNHISRSRSKRSFEIRPDNKCKQNIVFGILPKWCIFLYLFNNKASLKNEFFLKVQYLFNVIALFVVTAIDIYEYDKYWH